MGAIEEITLRRRTIETHLELIRARHPAEQRKEVEDALLERLAMLETEESAA
ncbi:MAG: hypothetical protein AB1427_08740 [Thermodesulfobacteriota bacterium]